MKLAILMTKHYRTLSVAALLDVFDTLNKHYLREGKPAFFSIRLLTSENSEVRNELFGGYPIRSLDDLQNDLIFIPAFDGDELPQYIQMNGCTIPWLQSQFSSGAHVASFCTGAFLLAASGLLNARRATTHLHAADFFRSSFPEVQLHSKEVVTDDNGVYTSGGATNSFLLMLHLIRKFCGNEKAVNIAKHFAIDMDRHHQVCYGSFTPQMEHGDKLVSLAQEQIKYKYGKINTVDEILREIPSSRRNLLRRFKSVTGFTPIQYLQQTRIEAAKKLLEETNKSVAEIMFSAGYNDMKSFRKLFLKNVGMPPSAYREKFSLQKV